MSGFPGSPRLLKAALVGMDRNNPLASVIAFQYNPDSLTRRLEARATGGGEGTARSEAFRLNGPARETFSLSAEIDATDLLERGDPRAARLGIYPALSALEMLLYPKSRTVLKNLALAEAGTLEILPPEAPMTLFVWGPKRILPVRLTGLSITEESFDTRLNPIRAKVDLSLLVLSYADLDPDHPGHSLFLAHQVVKELMATAHAATAVESLGTSLGVP
ncbi:hypothetical protein [Streptomyces sp. NPDC001530]|uniref:hypothetical protein n=1 Tax=Streptomyces sp. NPDC001530 TaxID=3364582 RepID=UPI0036B7BF7B